MNMRDATQPLQAGPASTISDSEGGTWSLVRIPRGPTDPTFPPRPRPIPRPAPVPPPPVARGDTMNPGEVLPAGQALTSANGIYRLTFQTDGNLVLYSGSVALWACNTFSNTLCTMQGDGNLVLYTSSMQPTWASNTNGSPGAHLVVQDDGNVVIYQPDGRPIWATNTVRTVGDSTLIYRARIKRWTSIPFFGTKGNDTILVPLPKHARVRSVCIEPINTISASPDYSSPIGTQVGGFGGGARLTNVVTDNPDAVVISTHWWFNAFEDAEYSLSVWVTRGTEPDAGDIAILDDGSLNSVNVDGVIAAQIETWFEANGTVLIAAGVALATLCVDIASLGTATPITTPLLIAAIGAAATAGVKVLTSTSGKP